MIAASLYCDKINEQNNTVDFPINNAVTSEQPANASEI